MLFHVTANHDHMTCPARAGGRDSDEVSALLREQMLIGKAEVLPVSDAIARRKQGGQWGA